MKSSPCLWDIPTECKLDEILQLGVLNILLYFKTVIRKRLYKSMFLQLEVSLSIDRLLLSEAKDKLNSKNSANEAQLKQNLDYISLEKQK